MKLLHLFIDSLLLPGKKAVFNINRTPMGHAIGYLCLIVFIAVLPQGYHLYFSDKGMGNELPVTLFILSFIFVYYGLYMVFSMIIISLIAYIASGVQKSLKRRLTYQNLWKTSCFTLTIPLLLSILLNEIGLNTWISFIIASLYILIITYKIILIYPKKEQVQKTRP